MTGHGRDVGPCFEGRRGASIGAVRAGRGDVNRPWPGRVRRRAGQAGLIFVAVTLAVLSVAFATQSVAAASVSPIQPGNQPTPVAGAANGLLPGADLVNVAPGCQAYRAAGPSIGLLLTEARDRDVALGTEQCYRSLQGQLSEQQVWTAAGNERVRRSGAVIPKRPSGGNVDARVGKGG